MEKKISLCIHGHFYQPPRENAWTNEIEIQPSAAPFHDWNERILQECYKPNSEAVIVDEHDTVIKRVNNYEYYNFDFGPTLISWIRKKHPKTYSRIIEADKKSTEFHAGHGNAIAMCYSHMIMPLSNYNDKVTQIRWGVEDFKFHFGRQPEGIWLPETACNLDTIDVMIDEGIQYIILDPSQADVVRKIPRGKWTDVSHGNIDTQIPYRHYHSKRKNKFLNIIFFNGPLSRNIAFDDHIYDSHRLMNRINQVPVNESEIPALVSVAVDGETFGHHKRYTERTMSYLFDDLIVESKYHMTNLGEFLSLNTPEMEVRIKAGEGTSWSCPHGVGRWKEDCGCGRTAEYPSQQWRKPLRESLDLLRDELIPIFEKYGGMFMKDVWAARNDFIKLILNSDKETEDKFFSLHAIRKLEEFEKRVCIEILEMQKYAMLMFTSCGWFFSDISGIEAKQILQYASKAMELANNISGAELEEVFLQKLEEAKSNLAEEGSGRNIYEKMISESKRRKDVV